MKIKIIAIILLVFGVSFSCANSNATTTQNPEMVVRRYIELSKNGEFEKIKKLTTVPPEEYWENLLEKFGLNDDGNDSAENKGGFTANSDNTRSNNQFLKRVNSGYPKLIYRNKEVVREVTKLQIEGRIAKVISLTDSELSTKHKGKLEFYLYLINDEWKIFMIE